MVGDHPMMLSKDY